VLPQAEAGWRARSKLKMLVPALAARVLGAVYARVARTRLNAASRCAACGVVKDLHRGISVAQRRRFRAGSRRCFHCAAMDLPRQWVFTFSPLIVRTPTSAFVLNGCEYVSWTRVLIHLRRVAGLNFAAPHAALVCEFLGSPLCAGPLESWQTDRTQLWPVSCRRRGRR
jgi:hypothetical protein